MPTLYITEHDFTFANWKEVLLVRPVVPKPTAINASIYLKRDLLYPTLEGKLKVHGNHSVRLNRDYRLVTKS